MQKEAMNLKLTGKGYGRSWREGRVREKSQLNNNLISLFKFFKFIKVVSKTPIYLSYIFANHHHFFRHSHR